MIFIDSNIWCYYFDSSAKEHNSVASYIDNVIDKTEIAMNSLIIMEISHYLIKNLGPIKGKEKIEKILSFPFLIIDFDYNMLISSITMLAKYSHSGIGGRDATILAAMAKLGIKKLVTHDSSFKSIDFIEVIDPAR